MRKLGAVYTIAAVTAEAAYEDDPDAEFFGPVDEADFVGWPCAPAVMKAMAEALGTVGFLEQRRGARFVYRSPYVDFAVELDRRRGALRLTARDRDFPQPNIWWVRVQGRDHGRVARTLFRLFEETASLDIDRLDNELRVAFPDVAELSHEGVVIVDARRADGLY
jgi:hypothetical protein